MKAYTSKKELRDQLRRIQRQIKRVERIVANNEQRQEKLLARQRRVNDALADIQYKIADDKSVLREWGKFVRYAQRRLKNGN